MTTYARIIGGYAVDVVITPPTLQERFNAEWLAAQTFIAVPDGTVSGAKDNGNGTFTNPTTPTPPVAFDPAKATAEFNASLLRRANALAAKGKHDKATFFLKQNGL